MIDIQIDDATAIARLEVVRQQLRANIRDATEDAAARLLSLVQGKLSGEVLNSRTGALLRSIHVETVEIAEGIEGRVSSDGSVPYARIQEYGGRLNIPALTPVNAKALAFAYGGRLVFAKNTAAHLVVLPERSYMRSSLDEIGTAFAESIRDAIAGTIA